ncbi:hypothetical protein MTO96_018186 [Rhipicephalus appendiculatus]
MLSYMRIHMESASHSAALLPPELTPAVPLSAAGGRRQTRGGGDGTGGHRTAGRCGGRSTVRRRRRRKLRSKRGRRRIRGMTIGSQGADDWPSSTPHPQRRPALLRRRRTAPSTASSPSDDNNENGTPHAHHMHVGPRGRWRRLNGGDARREKPRV